jgi:FAD/FMN-containing dehydrogenase/Fe-S oxidoreductase
MQKNESNRFPPVEFPYEGRPIEGPFVYRDRIQSIDLDSEELAERLRRAVTGEVRFDNRTRALYATDASNYRQVPIGVVLPRDVDDVIATVAIAREFGAPILSRGGGTSLAGQCCNVAVILDFSKYMNGIIEMNPAEKYAWVEPGIILDDLRDAAEKHNLTFGPDPATHTRCTLGGMIGNNSCGVHALMAGKTVDNIEELEVLTYDGVRMRIGPTSSAELQRIIAQGGRRGAIYEGLARIRDTFAEDIRAKYPRIPRRVSGYNLDELLADDFNVARSIVGSEGTCVVVLAAKCRLVYSPPARTLVVIGYPSVYDAADHVPEVLAQKPIGLEGLDDLLIQAEQAKNLNPRGIALLPPGGGWLFVEFGGETRDEANERARHAMSALQSGTSSMTLFDDPLQQKLVWAVRESGLGATAYVPRKTRTWEGWEDAAVAPAKLGGYLRDLRKLLEKFEYGGDLYGHFGDGCVHTRTNFDLQSEAGIAKYRRFIEEAADLVVSYGGSFSGEHGDGQSRAALLPKMFGERLIGAFREFKSLWDPEWKMNPGKLVDPYDPTENLRLGADYKPWSPKTHFQFPDDEGRMDVAMLRCVGVGACRRMDGGTMCPSFMVTREEEHSTRGRAHLLYEMFQGKEVPASWQNEEVKEALDLCLSCKGCKGDCPVNVDVATYKAEFLSHYYEGRMRPMAAYTMGWIHMWARLASLAPDLANWMMSLPMTKTIGKIAKERRMPRFARRTFVEWFRGRVIPSVVEGPGRKAARESWPSAPSAHPGPSTTLGMTRGRVLLWPDTFNNHLTPDTAIAAVDVLEAAGYEVVLPSKPLCCGRPLYDWGFLPAAKKLLLETIDVLRDEVNAGTPIVGLEPSCVSVFRDELPNLFPNDADAVRLSRSFFTLSELLARDQVELPQLKRKAIVQGHCHHKAIMKFESEEVVLGKAGLDFEHLDSGCCGMAGAFGFDEDNYELSLRIGERVLLPRVRAAARDTLIVADGFSCREQIAQTTDRKALHLAQVLQMALREGPEGPRGGLPERGYVEEVQGPDVGKALRRIGIGAAIVGAGLLLLRALRRRRRPSPLATGRGDRV